MKICILGTGNWAKVHAKIIAQNKNLQLVGFFSRSRRSIVESDLNYVCYSSIAEMIKKCAPNICLVANATRFHYEDAITVLREGCGVVIEKPIDVSVVELTNLHDLSRENGVFAGVCLPQRYDEIFQQLRLLSRSNYFGPIDFIDIKTFYSRSDESIERILSQTLNDNQYALLKHYGIHYYDATCYALDLKNLRFNMDLSVDNIRGTFRSGTLLLTVANSKTQMSITFSTNSSPGRRNSLEVIGKKKSLYVNCHGIFSEADEQLYVSGNSSFEDHLKLLWLDLYQLSNSNDLRSSRIALGNLLNTNHLFPECVSKTATLSYRFSLL